MIYLLFLSQSTVLLDATSALLVPIANSPLETVKSPSISNSLNTDFAPELLMIRLKKLLLEPVVILLPDPLNVTVPAVGVKPPLFPLSSQLLLYLYLYFQDQTHLQLR